MKRLIGILILAVLVASFTGCTNNGLLEKYPPQSRGSITVEDTLIDYSKAFSNIDYTTFTGYEILPFVTKEWEKTWLDELASQYVDSYRRNKFVREYTNANISNVVVKDDLTTATLVIDSIQKKPDERSCESVPEKITLIKVNGKWLIDKVEKK